MSTKISREQTNESNGFYKWQFHGIKPISTDALKIDGFIKAPRINVTYRHSMHHPVLLLTINQNIQSIPVVGTTHISNQT